MEHRTTQHQRSLRKQRGTAYILVLSITTLLVTLGIAATQLAQGQIEQGNLDQDLAKARHAAMSFQDVICRRNTGSTTWRDGVTGTTWYQLPTQDSVNLFYAYKDPIDGDLRNNHTDPFVLYTLAYSGTAFRIYSAEYSVDVDGKWTRNTSTFKQEVFTK